MKKKMIIITAAVLLLLTGVMAQMKEKETKLPLTGSEDEILIIKDSADISETEIISESYSESSEVATSASIEMEVSNADTSYLKNASNNVSAAVHSDRSAETEDEFMLEETSESEAINDSSVIVYDVPLLAEDDMLEETSEAVNDSSVIVYDVPLLAEDDMLEETSEAVEEPDPRNMSDEELAEYLDGGDAALYDESEYKGEGPIPLW